MKRRRIIQVGVGGMGLGWTDRIAESRRWAAAAYVDVNPKNLAVAAERHGIPKDCCFLDVHAALKAVEADALLDVTPQQFRKEVCLAAFKQGLHVMSEKPLADTLENAKTIVKTAEKAGRVYMVGQNYRFQPVMQTVKRFIEKGRLGQLGYVGVSFHKGPHFGGYREEMAYPLVLDMSIHHFDLMRCLLGADVVAVQGVSSSTAWNWNKGDAVVMAQLEMNNGVTVNYFGSWVSTGWETEWNADWRIEGSKGVLLLDRNELFFSQNPEERRPVPLVRMPRTHQAYLLEDFRTALDTGREPETSGRNNLNSLATTHAVVRAVQEKRRVAVRELIK
ncbi:MAG TPA: Gfo/Idh/MocA family oxidoreductase [Candidatus Hydrogenedentes bacterium]|nr:Gfo/Idh/MocA family oxidoreductase [Candidatus Hydrogenedentota bacterium]